MESDFNQYWVAWRSRFLSLCPWLRFGARCNLIVTRLSRGRNRTAASFWRMLTIFRSLVLFAGLSATLGGAAASPRASHVFIISIDGGKPAVIEQSEMPVLKRLAAEGACTWSANTISPSLTLPSHTSMLTGVGPDKHHILWNAWNPRKGVVTVATIFAQAKAAGFSTAMYVGKEKFRHLVQPGAVDKFVFDPCPRPRLDSPAAAGSQPKARGTVSAQTVAHRAAQFITGDKPELCFIHFTDPDDAGHAYGWGSEQQIRAFHRVDCALGKVLGAIEKAGIADDSVLIITADHGGHAKTHGLSTPEDMRIPWISWGKGVRKGVSLTGEVTTYDTGATALWLLGVPLSPNIDGKPVDEAFSSTPDHLARQNIGSQEEHSHVESPQ